MAAKERIIRFITNPKVLLGLFIVLAVGASLIEYAKGNKADTQTHYNNFMIFRASFYNLINGVDLYVLHPEQYYDLYKYPPAFALFFGLFVWMPVWLGLVCWNLLNTLVLFSAIISIKRFNEKQRAFALLFIVVELLTNIQNSQSNALIAGLMIWAYNCFEDGKVARAALFITLATFIKPFGLVAAALFLFYPQKVKFSFSLMGWCAVLAIIPLVATPMATLQFQYNSWLTMLQADHAASLGLSVAGGLEVWFGATPDKMLITIAGVVLFCLAYLNLKAWQQPGFKILLLASALIWTVIFNHKAESPTFIIAVAGVALWYYAQKPSTLNLVLLLLVFVFTCLSPTDLFPRNIRIDIIIPYQLKVLPCILVWLKILYDQLTYKPLNFAT
jgi:hypothetical protein